MFPAFHRPLRAHIDLNALQHNLQCARHYLPQSGFLWAVVKADAYGHGVLRCAQALASAPCPVDGFALIEIEAATHLRRAGVKQPMLLLEGCYHADELALCFEEGYTPVIHNTAQAAALLNHQPDRHSACQALPIYLKLNTGMNRLGLELEEILEWLPRLLAAPQVGQITLMSHFADADETGPGIQAQLQRLSHIQNTVHAAGHADFPLSLANSAALLRHAASSCNSFGHWARPGIMLYGSSPFSWSDEAHRATHLGLQPVMSLKTELISVREVQAGERLGYGGTFTAPQRMRIGIAAAGYADGYPRHAPTGTPVLVNNQRTQLLGRVSMDKICVDLSPIPDDDAQIGCPVTLWGEHLSVDEIAHAAGTISYEILCALHARVPVIEIPAAPTQGVR